MKYNVSPEASPKRTSGTKGPVPTQPEKVRSYAASAPKAHLSIKVPNLKIPVDSGLN